MTDTKLPSKLCRWSSIATAIFGGVCNLSCLILVFYQEHCRQGQFDWGFWFSPAVAISLAPLLVLFALRHLLPVVVVYTIMLGWILARRIDYLQLYCPFRDSTFHKSDEPGLLLVILGMISIAVFLAWAAIRFATFMWGSR